MRVWDDEEDILPAVPAMTLFEIKDGKCYRIVFAALNFACLPSAGKKKSKSLRSLHGQEKFRGPRQKTALALIGWRHSTNHSPPDGSPAGAVYGTAACVRAQVMAIDVFCTNLPLQWVLELQPSHFTMLKTRPP